MAFRRTEFCIQRIARVSRYLIYDANRSNNMVLSDENKYSKIFPLKSIIILFCSFTYYYEWGGGENHETKSHYFVQCQCTFSNLIVVERG